MFHRLLETLVSTMPSPPPESGEAECAPPVPFTEADNDPTEEVGPPTMPSPLNADSAFELANRAVDAGKYDEAKAYLRYADMYSKGLCFTGRL